MQLGKAGQSGDWGGSCNNYQTHHALFGLELVEQHLLGSFILNNVEKSFITGNGYDLSNILTLCCIFCVN